MECKVFVKFFMLHILDLNFTLTKNVSFKVIKHGFSIYLTKPSFLFAQHVWFKAIKYDYSMCLSKTNFLNFFMIAALLSHHIHHHLHIQLFTCNTSMDQGIWHEELSQILRTHQDWQPSHTVLTNNWDSEESDTESLAQGMVYQKRLQMCIKQNKYTLLGKKNADSLQREDVDDKHSNEDENDNFQVYDNIKVVKHFHAKRNPALQTDVGTKLNKREGRW